MVQSPGDMIREARQANGVTPEEVQKRTRVRASLLGRIEGDLLSQLPDDPYCRTLYSTVAEAVGADADAVLAAYDELRATRAEASLGATVVAEPPERTMPVGRIVSVVLLLVAVTASLVFLARRPGGFPGLGGGGAVTAERLPEAGPEGVESGTEEMTVPPAAVADADSGVAQPAVGEVSPQPSEVVTRPSSPAPRSAASPAPLPPLGEPVKARQVSAPREEDSEGEAPGGQTGRSLESDPYPSDPAAWSTEVVAEVRALHDTWVHLTIDGDLVRTGVLPEGEKRVWRASEVLRFDVGRADGLEIILNRHPVVLPSRGTGVLHFELTRDLLPGNAEPAASGVADRSAAHPPGSPSEP